MLPSYKLLEDFDAIIKLAHVPVVTFLLDGTIVRGLHAFLIGKRNRIAAASQLLVETQDWMKQRLSLSCKIIILGGQEHPHKKEITAIIFLCCLLTSFSIFFHRGTLILHMWFRIDQVPPCFLIQVAFLSSEQMPRNFSTRLMRSHWLVTSWVKGRFFVTTLKPLWDPWLENNSLSPSL